MPATVGATIWWPLESAIRGCNLVKGAAKLRFERGWVAVALGWPAPPPPTTNQLTVSCGLSQMWGRAPEVLQEKKQRCLRSIYGVGCSSEQTRVS